MIDQHKSLSEKFIKKGFWLYLFSFIIAPIGYIIKIIISSELSVSEVGIIYGVISLITMIAAYNDLGITGSLQYFLPRYITEKRYDKVKTILTYAFIVQMVTGTIIGLFFFYGADYLADYYFKSNQAINTIKIFSFYFILINLFQIISTFFLAIQNTLYNKLIQFFRIIFAMGSVLILFFGNNGNITNYSFTWLIGLIFGIILANYLFINKYYKIYLKNEKITWEKTLLKEVFKYSIITFIALQSSAILGQIDMQMIIYLLGTTDAGYYTNYLTIIAIPFVFIGPILSFILPIVSELNAKKEIKQIKIIKLGFYNNFIIIGLLINVLFFIFAENIAYILFGESFIKSGAILQYSILLLIFNFLLNINFNILTGIGKIKNISKIISIAIFINFFSNLILINYYGVEGAALATGIGWFIIWLMSEISLGKKYYITINYYHIVKNISILIIIGYSISKLNFLFEGKDRIESLLLLIVISIIYFLFFTIINKKELKGFFSQIKKLKNN